ncbi:MAG: peptidoglycan DD-metalloendopeptidase family protein [Bacteroidota bacterium]|nr:peptidoglycan DD-metalloendopeptidase family protein [Bacteroidota bacterium]
MSKLEQFLKKYSETFANILPFDLNQNSVYKLNLSVNNSELTGVKDINTDFLLNYINEKLEKNNKQIAVGGYGEERIIYKKSEYFGTDEDARSIHLGIDVWCKENTTVSAPMDSFIHSFNNNDNFGDYGPTIILEHHIESQIFYTLYGHLTKKSLTNIKVHDKVNKGEIFAKVGNSNENGNWPPHLHFQIISDMKGNSGDFPGVSSKQEKEKWLKICPNPSLIIYP